MKNFLIIFLALFWVAASEAAPKLQGSDFLAPATITGAGGSLSQLLNANYVWDNVNSQQLSTTITTNPLLTTVGTIGTGVWNGTPVGAAYGGTGINTSAATGVPSILAGVWSTASSLSPFYGGLGISTTPANGAIPIGNGTNYTATTLTAGSNITITNGAGSITIAASGGGGSGTLQTGQINCGITSGDANTMVLLTFDNGSTINDYGLAQLSGWSLSGSVTAGAAKFGAGGLSGSSSVITNTSGAWLPGTGDFTVDYWFKAGATGTSYGIFSSDQTAITTGVMDVRYIAGTGLTMQYRQNTGTTYTALTAAYTMPDTNYHHHAWVRTAGTLTLYVDGTAIGSAANSTNFNQSSQFQVGGSYYVGFGASNLDEFRMSNIARWTSNFTPPTSAYNITSIGTNTNNFISSVTQTSAGLCTVNFTGGIFTTAPGPVCTCTVFQGGGSGLNNGGNPLTGESDCAFISSATTSSVSMQTRINGALAISPVYLMCQ